MGLLLYGEVSVMTFSRYIYKYQNLGTMFICGALNGRCGNLEDYISGVDDIEHKMRLISKLSYMGNLRLNFL